MGLRANEDEQVSRLEPAALAGLVVLHDERFKYSIPDKLPHLRVEQYLYPRVSLDPVGQVAGHVPSQVAVADQLEQGAEVAVISDDEMLTGRAGVGFVVPAACPEELSPVLYAIPPQVLAHLKRLDPDAPRGLSKVTKTW
jgi:hypothetical protein